MAFTTRRVALCLGLAAALTAHAGRRVKIIDLVDPQSPTSPRALLAAVLTSKPSAARDANLMLLDAKLREKGANLEDPDQTDAMAVAVFQRIFEDMAAPSDVWTCDDDEAPRADVLGRKRVLLLPGQATTGFSKAFTVTPKGKRLASALAAGPATLTVAVARSEAEWQASVMAKGWGAALHQVKHLDDVARVGVTFLAPGAKHQRPVWIAYFKRAKSGAPWEFALLEPAEGKAQKAQEVNLMWVDPRATPGALHKKLVLAVRMEDVRLIPESRSALLDEEAKWFSLAGLTECPVDAKTVDWLERYRADSSPMVRAAAVVKTWELGGTLTGAELADVIANLRLSGVVLEAQTRLDALLDGGQAGLTDEQKNSLARLAGTGKVSSLPEVVRVKGAERTTYFRKRPYGWEELKPKK